VKPGLVEQIENGEQSLQFFWGTDAEVCCLYSSSQLSKKLQGTTALNKI